MFPTHVGMNRHYRQSRISRNDVPHTRGDEPTRFNLNVDYYIMFPTHVGMNRSPRPHSGVDEFMFPTHVGMNRPMPHDRLPPRECSPHTWG